jgi:hypothetical protein
LVAGALFCFFVKKIADFLDSGGVAGYFIEQCTLDLWEEDRSCQPVNGKQQLVWSQTNSEWMSSRRQLSTALFLLYGNHSVGFLHQGGANLMHLLSFRAKRESIYGMVSGVCVVAPKMAGQVFPS